jgi:UDP-N-acetylglucosamine acyltransferase
MAHVHGTAVIGGGAFLGDGVSIGAHAVVERGALIGGGTVIADNAVVRGNVAIGRGCFIGEGAVVGGLSPDFPMTARRRLRNLQGESSVVIGDGTVILEHVTVHRATVQSANTVVGARCTIGPWVHVAHDCIVGDDVVFRGKNALGGHTHIGDWCHFGMKTAVHQFSTIGDCVCMADNAATPLDVPPYTTIVGRGILVDLNYDGLRRMGVGEDDIDALRRCFTDFYGRSGDVKARAKAMVREGLATTKEARNFLQFFLADAMRPTIAKRQIVGMRPSAMDD